MGQSAWGRRVKAFVVAVHGRTCYPWMILGLEVVSLATLIAGWVLFFVRS